MILLPENALRGSYPPAVTPFINNEVDYQSYAVLIEYLIQGGSHGIVVNGTTGEPTTLTLQERSNLVKLAVNTSAGRVPVVAATGSQNYQETLQLMNAAMQAGADAMLIVTPYFLKPPERGLIEYYVSLAGETDLPVMIYHIPGRAGVSLPPAAIEKIASRAPNLVGVKHASTDLAFVTETLARLGPDFRIFVGLEELSFPMMALGAAGLMNAAANIVPAKIAELAVASRNKDMEHAQRLHNELFELNQAIFWDTNPIPMKYMLRRLGILSNNEHRLPMMKATPELEHRIDALLTRLELASVIKAR
ncbi:4-hydroxy-tetrahydrodipicolinate synthase [Pseudomonas veronii]|jgi:4-hydroxy-tetrahydrodipicolinate synthase|uniref:4-hydroxy-tetrahydrodipicolinate synthase n=1 Tax=Pseudomonas veronii TaxID=76761 RepID=UPI0018E87328|nr:4-hydroxy-tetrahydrodipicolinate synthase [Pseudomonas veronii]MBJ2180649.1 4-hydroxy-tetrahydrodipicolinate synthase [Pseudomonas veronii]